MSELLSTLWPLFALILAGFALKRAGFPGDSFWPAAEKINYFVFFPALLVASLAKAPIRDPGILRMAGVILLCVLTTYLGFTLFRRWRNWAAPRFGPLVQGAIRFNTYLGLALVSSLYGAKGLSVAAVALAVMVPTVNVLSVMALTEKRAGAGPGTARLLRQIAVNPLILACLAGALIAFAGLTPAYGFDRLLKLLSSVSLPLGLLCVGAALQPETLKAETPTLTANALFRLLVMPVLAVAGASLFSLGAIETRVLIVLFALPTATSAYVLTVQMKGDAALMAGLITLQTLLAAVSLSAILMILS